MPLGFLANPLVQSVLGWVAKWLWGKLSEAWKEKLADDQIKKNVKLVLDKYEDLVLKFDELNDAGKLTEDLKNEIRKQKIKLEEDLINRIQR